MSTSRRDRDTANVPSITSAAPSLAEDQARRTHRYLLQMGIRLVCFIAAILVGGGWVTWVLIGAAIVLPYTAVLFANAGKDQAHYDSSPMEYLALPSRGTERLAGPEGDKPTDGDVKGTQE